MKNLALFLMAACVVGAVGMEAWTQVAPDAPNTAPPSLKTVRPLAPPNLGQFVRDRTAAIQLGKAIYWDMQLGSDGVTACATCHFHAGTDGRTKNTMNPGHDGALFAGSPNLELALGDFPFHQFADLEDPASPLLRTHDDVAGSAGILARTFVRQSANAKIPEVSTPIVDTVFNVGGVPVRQVGGRNAPSVINSAYNFHNFWDGRAHDTFNGVNSFGPSDGGRGIFFNNGTTIVEQPVRIPRASLASQAVGPPVNPLEMTYVGRTWPDIGRKMLRARPLAYQQVQFTDSKLGPLARFRFARGQAVPLTGLKVRSYTDLVKQAFQPNLWDSRSVVRVNDDGTRTVLPRGRSTKNVYSQMEMNFSLFFGLAVMLYEGELISDDSKYDKFMDGTAELAPLELEGLNLFLNQGQCIVCHFGAQFTSATAQVIVGLQQEALPDFPVLLNGAGMSPPVTTPMQGVGDATINLLAGLIEADARFTDGQPTAVELHFGAVGTDGPVMFNFVIDLDAAGLPRPRARLDGTAANFIPSPEVPTFNDAVAAIMAQNAYVIAKTAANPAGEVRGQFTLPPAAGPVEFMGGVVSAVFYDVGFYNLGVRFNPEDAGRGGSDPFGVPLGYATLGEMKALDTLPAHFENFVPDLPAGVGIVSNLGAFKTPSLRNVELTGPYFHNGSMLVLGHVMDFYSRGGIAHNENLPHTHPLIETMKNALAGQHPRHLALIAFLKTLTDERVRQESAPFDHPQLFVPVGLAGNHQAVLPDKNPLVRKLRLRGLAPNEGLMELPALGVAGRPALGLPPLGTFLNATHEQ